MYHIRTAIQWRIYLCSNFLDFFDRKRTDIVTGTGKLQKCEKTLLCFDTMQIPSVSGFRLSAVLSTSWHLLCPVIGFQLNVFLFFFHFVSASLRICSDWCEINRLLCFYFSSRLPLGCFCDILGVMAAVSSQGPLKHTARAREHTEPTCARACVSYRGCLIFIHYFTPSSPQTIHHLLCEFSSMLVSITSLFYGTTEYIP